MSARVTHLLLPNCRDAFLRLSRQDGGISLGVCSKHDSLGSRFLIQIYDMEKPKGNKEAKIELRSEKVRQLLGEIPPSLVRWGTVIICLIFAALVCALLFIPSPYGDGEESILRYIIHHIKL